MPRSRDLAVFVQIALPLAHARGITIAELVTVGVTMVTMAPPIMNIVIHERPLSQALSMLSSVSVPRYYIPSSNLLF